MRPARGSEPTATATLCRADLLVHLCVVGPVPSEKLTPVQTSESLTTLTFLALISWATAPCISVSVAILTGCTVTPGAMSNTISVQAVPWVLPPAAGSDATVPSSGLVEDHPPNEMSTTAMSTPVPSFLVQWYRSAHVAATPWLVTAPRDWRGRCGSPIRATLGSRASANSASGGTQTSRRSVPRVRIVAPRWASRGRLGPGTPPGCPLPQCARRGSDDGQLLLQHDPFQPRGAGPTPVGDPARRGQAAQQAAQPLDPRLHLGYNPPRRKA